MNLSRNTVAERDEDIVDNFHDKLRENNCLVAFFIEGEECIDIINTSQLAIFTRALMMV